MSKEWWKISQPSTYLTPALLHHTLYTHTQSLTPNTHTEIYIDTLPLLPYPQYQQGDPSLLLSVHQNFYQWERVKGIKLTI